MKHGKIFVIFVVLLFAISFGLNSVSAEITDDSSNYAADVNTISVSSINGGVDSNNYEDSLCDNSANINDDYNELKSGEKLNDLCSVGEYSDLENNSVSTVSNSYDSLSKSKDLINSNNIINFLPSDVLYDITNGKSELENIAYLIKNGSISMDNTTDTPITITIDNNITVGSNITGTVKGVNNGIVVAVIKDCVYYGYILDKRLTIINSSDLSAGKYSDIYMDIVSIHGISTVVFNATVHKIKSKVVDVTSGTVYNGKYYKVTLKDGNGKYVVNKKVTITILGKSYTVTTDKNGVAKVKLSISNKYIGKSLKVTYKFNNVNYTAISGSSTIKVIKMPTNITKVSSSIIKNHKYFYVKLATKSGKALAGKTITMISKVSGKIYSIKTNSKGIAKVDLWVKKCPLGKYYKYTFKYAGSKYYKSSSATFSVKLVK